MANLSFTLYEILGYLFPGSVTLTGFILLYWALFVPKVPLGVANFQPSLVLWGLILIAAYLLGHAAQAVSNRILGAIEKSALAMQGATWMRERAKHTAADLVGISADKIEPGWVFRVLDEYAVQAGQPGDRDMFIYREGFYRATSIALFFLSLTLLIRTAVPGASIQFTRWLFAVNWSQLLTTALVTGLVGWFFLERYKRFVAYRVTRAVLSALVIRSASPKNKIGKESPSTPE